MRNCREGVRIVRINDQAGDFVGFIRDDRACGKYLERQVRERNLRRYALFGGARGNARQIVSGTRWCGFGEERFQVPKWCVTLPILQR